VEKGDHPPERRIVPLGWGLKPCNRPGGDGALSEGEKMGLHIGRPVCCPGRKKVALPAKPSNLDNRRHQKLVNSKVLKFGGTPVRKSRRRKKEGGRRPVKKTAVPGGT